MISVIIPTMWKFKPFPKFLGDMLSSPYVGEVLIVDNHSIDNPNHEIFKHPKITMHNFGRNTFVNPAWNFGVQHAKYDKVCILNDDVIFDLKLFHRIYLHLTPEKGVFGISPGVKDTVQIPVTTGEIDIIHSPNPYHYRDHLGFGMLMMLHRHNWIPIPQGLDIFWGDNFIYDTLYFKLNQNYLITNMFHHTPYASTTSTVEGVNDIVSGEGIVYNTIMPELINRIKVENAYRTGFL